MILPTKNKMLESKKILKLESTKEDQEFNSNFSIVGNKLIANFLKNGHTLAFKLMIYLTKVNIEIHDTEVTTSNQKDFFNNHMKDVAFKIDLEDFMKYVGVKTLKTLKPKLIGMQNMQFIFAPTKDIPIDIVSVFTRLTIYKKDLYIKMPEVLFKEIGKTFNNLQESGYTKIFYLNRLMKIKAVASIRMFILLHTLEGYDNGARKQTTMNLEELNGYFGQNYKSASEFYKFVLKPVLFDLNPIFNFTIEEVYGENIGKGRKPIIAYRIIYESTKLRIDKPIEEIECII